METRANTIVVGLFMLSALVASFALVYWFGSGGDKDRMQRLDVRIQGAVSGLVEGSIVQFNGITVGRVTGLDYDKDDPRFVTVNTLVEPDVPLREDTRVSVGARGLSGGSFIQLEGGTPDALRLVQPNTPRDGVVELEGNPSAFTDIIDQVSSIAVRAEKVVGVLEGFVERNDKVISDTLLNTRKFSQALADNSEGVEQFLASAQSVGVSLEALSGKIDGTVNRVEAILAAVDPQTVSGTLENVESFTKGLADQRAEIETLIQAAGQAVADVRGATARVGPIIGRIEETVQAVDPARVSTAIANLDQATARARAVLDVVDEQSVQRTISNVERASSSIVTASGRANDIITAIDAETVRALVADMRVATRNVSTLLAAVDAERVNTAVDDVSKAARAASEAATDARGIVTDVRKVTQPLGERSGDVEKILSDTTELAARLNESSKKVDALLEQAGGLLGTEGDGGLAAAARSTLAEFRRTARNFSSNMAQITGSVSRLADRGLADTPALIRSATQSLSRLDRVIRNIQDNPSSLISGSGGSRVRETTSGRPRR